MSVKGAERGSVQTAAPATAPGPAVSSDLLVTLPPAAHSSHPRRGLVKGARGPASAPRASRPPWPRVHMGRVQGRASLPLCLVQGDTDLTVWTEEEAAREANAFREPGRVGRRSDTHLFFPGNPGPPEPLLRAMNTVASTQATSHT